jgi:hypothetical protein
MDFDTNISNITFFIIQTKVNFQQNVFFQHTYVHLNEKLVEIFFVKSHESNFSIVIEMIQSSHIQYMIKYMIKYFIKFCTYLNHFKNICIL